MPLLDLQRKLHECGRLRIGTKTPKGFPTKLETWRATSQSKDLIEAIAEVYGGEVGGWKADPKGPQQWEVITDAKTMEIIVAPGQALSQFWELWNAGGCLRRCDGYTEMKTDGACICPADQDERRRQASLRAPTACKPTTRLSVILRDVPAIGLWRIETRGIYAALELSGMTEILEAATKRNIYLPATLRLDTRTSKEGGQTNRYAVPVIEVHRTFGQVASALGMSTNGLGELSANGTAAELSAVPVQQALPAATSPAKPEALIEDPTVTPAPMLTNMDEVGNPTATWKPLPPVEDEPLDAEVVAEQILNPTAPGAGRKPRSNAAEPIKRTGLAPRGRIIDPGQAPSTVEAPSTGPEDKSPVEVVVESEVVPGGAAPLDGDHPLVLAETQPPAEDAVSPTEALRAPLTRAQGLAKKAREAGLDDEARGDLIETLTKGRTRSSKEVTDNEAGTLHGWFHKVKSKTATLSYDPEGKACLLPVTS